MPDEHDRSVVWPGDAPSAVSHVPRRDFNDLTGLIVHGVAVSHVRAYLGRGAPCWGDAAHHGGTVVHIVIMGCGRVGSTLAHILEDRDNTVAVIDRDPEAFRRLGSAFKGDRITGIGFDRVVLTHAGLERADAFPAVSSGGHSHIISARVARETFSVQRVAARIYDPRRAEVYERLGIPTVATVRWTADQMLRKLLPEGGEPLWRDPTGRNVLAHAPFPPPR